MDEMGISILIAFGLLLFSVGAMCFYLAFAKKIALTAFSGFYLLLWVLCVSIGFILFVVVLSVIVLEK